MYLVTKPGSPRASLLAITAMHCSSIADIDVSFKQKEQREGTGGFSMEPADKTAPTFFKLLSEMLHKAVRSKTPNRRNLTVYPTLASPEGYTGKASGASPVLVLMPTANVSDAFNTECFTRNLKECAHNVSR